GSRVRRRDAGTSAGEGPPRRRYWGEVRPPPPLMGTDARDRALVEMWQRRMELEVLMPVAQTFRNIHPFFKGRIPQVAEWGEVSRRAATARFAWLDELLAERPFIAGDRYTIADITALV